MTICQERAAESDRLVLEAVLTAAESIVTFRRRYRTRSSVDAVLELLVIDPFNPARSPISCSGSEPTCEPCPTPHRPLDRCGCLTAWPNASASPTRSRSQSPQMAVGLRSRSSLQSFRSSCERCRRRSVISISSRRQLSARCSVPTHWAVPHDQLPHRAPHDVHL